MSSSKIEITKEKLDSFCSLTGATNERATFYLEAANGDLDLAIGNFFEGGNDNEEANDLEVAGARMGSNPTGQNSYKFFEDDDDDDDDEDYDPAEALRRAQKTNETKKPQPKSSKEGSRIMTLSSFHGNDESDEESGQAFYAGGSEASGQQILGPPRENAEKIIKNLFSKAKENGAREVESNEPSGSSSSNKNIQYGNGYRLGTGNEPTEIIEGPKRPKPPKVSVLKLWKNGFCVDDGPLRLYSDPKNKEFLASIEKGEPPRELIRQAEGGEVHLDMQDHREEEFVPPKNKYVLYNDGYKLGSPVPAVVSNASPNDQEANEKEAKRILNVDESKPVTQIQIRLSNGSRLIIKANQTHKVNDIRQYINRARPEYGNASYSLLTSFPNKELTNETESLTEANLLNAVIIQKLK